MQFKIYGIDEFGNKNLIDIKSKLSEAQKIQFWHEGNYKECIIVDTHENPF